MSNTNITELVDKLISYQGLDDYHTRLISALGLVAKSGNFTYDDTVEIPEYDSVSKTWTKVSVKISEAVSQLYKLINAMQAGASDFDADDFKYNVLSYDNNTKDAHQS